MTLSEPKLMVDDRLIIEASLSEPAAFAALFDRHWSGIYVKRSKSPSIAATDSTTPIAMPDLGSSASPPTCCGITFGRVSGRSELEPVFAR